jgi:hypothetical protein
MGTNRNPQYSCKPALKMKKNIELLEPDRIYHIYNRGINGENIFKEERNYRYFLEKYAKYIEPIADTFAYCLLKNPQKRHLGSINLRFQ